MVYPAGRGHCGVLPALRGSSVPVWCDSSFEGVGVCFQLGGGRLWRESSVPVSWEGVVWCVSSWEGSSVPVWCVSSWEGVVCASVVCFLLGGIVCASVVCFQLGGGRLCQCGVFPAERGRLCQCGVFPAGRGSSVPVWRVSSWEGVVCASVVFLKVVCASIYCFFGSSVPVCVSSWEGVVCGGGRLCL